MVRRHPPPAPSVDKWPYSGAQHKNPGHTSRAPGPPLVGKPVHKNGGGKPVQENGGGKAGEGVEDVTVAEGEARFDPKP